MTETRSRIRAATVCLLLVALQWGCASSPKVPDQRQIAGQPGGRSALGNPPFYEVFGKRYYVLDSSENFIERGIASWYGRDFHRQRTSSGETYDMHAMTAAHKTLPLPTWVEVTNLENGRKVIVKVNDRGPFVGDRIIDLSYAAATELDMVRAGTARVEVRALGTPAIQPFEEPPRQARAERRRRDVAPVSTAHAGTLDEAERYRRQLFIQVGAFSARDNAAKLAERLRDGGFDNVLVVSDDADALHRVRIGPFDDVAEYDRANDGLRRFGVVDTRLVVGN